MRTRNLSKELLLVAIFATCTWGCSGSTSTPEGTGGSPGTGGSNGTGGTSSTGGSVGTGGSKGTGGTASTGGSVGTGGASATSVGGSKASGGSGSGGSSTGKGGSTGSGGSVGSGGSTGNGGSSTGSGGRTGSGGSSTGGGGSTGSGGSSTGSGGSTGRGGSTGKGGSTGNGGSTGSGVDGGTSAQSAGCGKTSSITSSQYNNGSTISITVNGSQRRYILNIPTNYVNTTPYKFILAVHELNGNDKEMYSQKYYDLLPLSNNTVIFAAPNGVNGSTPCSGTGSGDQGCGWPSGNNNMQLMDAVVKQVTDNFCVDMNHIYASGWSYGASMSYEIGCERPLEQAATNGWGVRAIAIYAAAQMSGSCKPSAANPVAYYASHGTHDSVLNYSGGVTLAQNMATANGCTWQPPTSVSSGTHVCTKLAGCKSGYPLEFCSFNGDHTAYPDNGTESSSWGPQEVWTFLSQF